jgi:hypothetical protein
MINNPGIAIDYAVHAASAFTKVAASNPAGIHVAMIQSISPASSPTATIATADRISSIGR